MSENEKYEQIPESGLQALEAKARAVTGTDLSALAEKAIKSLQQQRHLSQEELHRMVTI